MKPTFPAAYWDAASHQFIALMKDKKTGRVWGQGMAPTRSEAIAQARSNQPPMRRVKNAIGWVEKHPFLAGAVVGAILGFRKGRAHGSRLPIKEMFVPAVALGVGAWVLQKLTGRVAPYLERMF